MSHSYIVQTWNKFKLIYFLAHFCYPLIDAYVSPLSAASYLKTAANPEILHAPWWSTCCFNSFKQTAETLVASNLPPLKHWILDSHCKYQPTKAHFAWTWSCCHHSNQSDWWKVIWKAAPTQLWMLSMPKLGIFSNRNPSTSLPLVANLSWCFTPSQTVELMVDSQMLYVVFIHFISYKNYKYPCMHGLSRYSNCYRRANTCRLQKPIVNAITGNISIFQMLPWHF